MDLLSQLMEHFSIRTGVFYSGNLCGVSSFNAQQGKEGHLHVLSAGELSLSSAHTEHRQLSQPCIVYLPNSTPHAIEGVGDGAEVVCANVEYRSGQMNPLLSALPDVIVIPFEEAPNLMPVIEVLSNESSQESSGQQYLMDKLSDALMALIFRHLIEQQKIDSGVFSALAHPRLASVVTAIHRLPARHYSIVEMASLAAMSRTQFIEAFKREVGKRREIMCKSGESPSLNRCCYKTSLSIGWRMKWGTTAILASLELFSMLRECRRVCG